MKNLSRFILIVVCLLFFAMLLGCAKQTAPTETVANSAKESISTIVAAKPECKDVGTVCNSQIDSIVASYELEVSNINKDLMKWKWSFWGLLVVIGAYLVKRILR